MNYQSACNNLEIDNINHLTIEIIKKQYKILALKYHPDKNTSQNSHEKFIQIKDSYEFLLKHYNSTDNNFNMSYNTILKSFFINILPSNIDSELYFNIFDNIISSCEDKALIYLEKIDITLLKYIYNELICKYKDVLHIDVQLINKIKSLIQIKEFDETIYLNPNFNDLYNNNLYKLNQNNKTYIIPLWHHELSYEADNNEIIVKCVPIIPNNISIDHNNNIIIDVEYNIQNIWKLDHISFNIDDKVFTFEKNKLQLLEYQTITLQKMGISKINMSDVFNVDDKSDIILNVHLKI
jgi:curved DNA-binding protein CbpA